MEKAVELSEKGMAFLVEREGAVSSMYNDTAGHCTVGVGHLIHKGNCDYPSQKDKDGFSADAPYLSGLSKKTITNLNAEKEYFVALSPSAIVNLLKTDKTRFEKVVNDKVSATLSQTQFDALVSFAFNVGPGSFTDSTLLKVLNEGKHADVPSEMKRWVKETKDGEKVVSNGLINRREKEATLFEKGTY